ncbi:unnamed protein product [Ectocarpus sp. 12 AP-2014]
MGAAAPPNSAGLQHTHISYCCFFNAWWSWQRHQSTSRSFRKPLAYEAFWKGNFDDGTAFLRMKEQHANRIRRRFAFELARFLSVRTRDVLKRRGLLIDHFPPRRIGWDLSSSADHDHGNEGSSFGSDEGGGEGTGGRRDDQNSDVGGNHGVWKRARASSQMTLPTTNDAGLKKHCPRITTVK